MRYSTSPFRFMAIVSVPLVVTYLIGFFEPPQNTGKVQVVPSIIFAFLMLVYFGLSFLGNIALTVLVGDVTLTVVTAYKKALLYFWRYLGVSVIIIGTLSLPFAVLYLALLSVTSGPPMDGDGSRFEAAFEGMILLLAFVPYISIPLFAVALALVNKWILAPFVLVYESQSVIDSLKGSAEYVKGRWWKIYGRVWFVTLALFLVFMLGNLLNAMVLSLGGFSGFVLGIAIIITMAISIVIAPFGIIYLYMMYRNLKLPGTVIDSAHVAEQAPSVN